MKMITNDMLNVLNKKVKKIDFKGKSFAIILVEYRGKWYRAIKTIQNYYILKEVEYGK